MTLYFNTSYNYAIALINSNIPIKKIKEEILTRMILTLNTVWIQVKILAENMSRILPQQFWGQNLNWI